MLTSFPETADELLRVIKTPTSLAQFLAPRRAEGEQYAVDPWLELTERKVLDAVLDKEHQRFVRVHLPRQVGKTTYSGNYLPLWILGMMADTRIIFISYSDDYSRIRGGEVKALMKTYGMKLFGVTVDPDKDADGDWKIKGRRGGMLSVGIGSQITGRSGDVIIIDDLIKNIIEAASAPTKSGHVGDYDASIRGGLQPGGTIIMTSTRWADDDLAGVLESRCKAPGYKGDRWEVVSIPAIAEPSDDEISELIDFEMWEDELGRKRGQPLQCRYTDPKLAWEDSFFYQLRASMDPNTFEALYQQNPTASEDGMFPPSKWARYRHSELPEMIATVRVWDAAATAGGGDWSVGTKLGKGDDGRYYVLDVWRDRLTSDEVLAYCTAD